MSYRYIHIIFALSILLSSSFAYSQKRNQNIDSLINVAGNGLSMESPDDTITVGRDLLKIAQSDRQKAKIYKILSMAYGQKKDMKKSMEMIFEAKSHAEKTGDDELIADVYCFIGDLYLRVYLHDKAKHYLEKSLQHLRQIPESNPNKHLQARMVYTNLGNLEFDKKNYAEAKKYYRYAYKDLKFIKKEKYVAYLTKTTLYDLGNTLYYLNQPDSAEYYLNKAFITKNIEIVDKDLDNFIRNSLSRVYSQKGLYKRAIDSLEVSLKGRGPHNIELRADIFLNLSNNYRKIDEQEKFLYYNEQHLRLKDSVQLLNAATIDTSIDSVERDHEKKITEANINYKYLVIFCILLTIIFIVAIIMLYYKRKRERRIFEKIIADLKQKLEAPKEEISVQQENSALPNDYVLSETEKEILAKLAKFEKSKKFTNAGLTISTLAVQLKTNNSYLSDVIKKHKGKNFNTYINELRISYICEKIITNSEYLNYKISYLAEESGFTSHSVFAVVFKSITGISPSAFIREAAKNETYKPKTVK